MDTAAIRAVGKRRRTQVSLFGNIFSGRGKRSSFRRTDSNGGVLSMKIKVPELCLVVLVGTSGSGKSTFARKHFKPTEILSSDFCRGLVSDDENDQTVTTEAFEVLHFIAAKRLTHMKLTVIDATNVQVDGRKKLLALAREYHA